MRALTCVLLSAINYDVQNVPLQKLFADMTATDSDSAPLPACEQAEKHEHERR